MAVSVFNNSENAEPVGFFLEKRMSKAAILVDGEYFLKKLKKKYPQLDHRDPEIVLDKLYEIITKHLDYLNKELYRVLFYDCKPLNKKVPHPIRGEDIDFGQSPQANFRLEFHEGLKRKQNTAVRLGYLSAGRYWTIRSHLTKKILNGTIKYSDLTENDIYFQMSQKGVDIKIGLDIASLAYKKLVDAIILISGDGDFISASKLARREGISFILDPLWDHVHPALYEHTDDVRSFDL